VAAPGTVGNPMGLADKAINRSSPDFPGNTIYTRVKYAQ